MNKTIALQILAASKEALSQYGVSSLGLFGSTLRDENGQDSDIDILIDFLADQETYRNYLAACDHLEAAFPGHRLDIVTHNSLSPIIGPKILREVQYV